MQQTQLSLLSKSINITGSLLVILAMAVTIAVVAYTIMAWFYVNKENILIH